MAKPQAWSHSALDTFVNCPRQFHARYVAKIIPYQPTVEMAEGNRVHKAFELRVAEGKELPFDLKQFEPTLAKLVDRPGEVYAERKIAFNTKAQPCNWQATGIWYRGVIDYTNIQPDESWAEIIDYKTGKPHNKFKQLISNSLWIFAQYPEVEKVKVSYYWTKTDNYTSQEYLRTQIPALWGQLLPDLRQYKEAFQTDIWQPRQSGLCRGWCPVRDCEFWKEKPTSR